MLKLTRPKLSLNRKNLLIAASGVLIFYTFFWRLGSLTPGLGPTESVTRQTAASFSSIIESPVNAPHSLLILAFQAAGLDSSFGLRLPSVLFGLLFIFCFYKIARKWFGRFVATASTLMFASSPLVILSARSVSAEVMYLLPLAICAAYFWLTKNSKPSIYALVCLVASLAVGLYTPGMIWLIIFGLIGVRSSIRPIINAFPKLRTVLLIFLSLIVISPLGLEIYRSPSTLSLLFLIPENLSLVETIKDIGWAGLAVFWHSFDHNLLQIGRLSLLNAAQLVTAIFGVYALWSRARSKTYTMLAVGLFSILGAALGGGYNFLLVAIAISSILSSAGLRYLLIEWQGVFPRNPLPATLASVLMGLIVAVSMTYGLRYALVAWPNTQDTKNVYVLK